MTSNVEIFADARARRSASQGHIEGRRALFVAPHFFEQRPTVFADRIVESLERLTVDW